VEKTYGSLSFLAGTRGMCGVEKGSGVASNMRRPHCAAYGGSNISAALRGCRLLYLLLAFGHFRCLDKERQAVAAANYSRDIATVARQAGVLAATAAKDGSRRRGRRSLTYAQTAPNGF